MKSTLHLKQHLPPKQNVFYVSTNETVPCTSSSPKQTILALLLTNLYVCASTNQTVNCTSPQNKPYLALPPTKLSLSSLPNKIFLGLLPTVSCNSPKQTIPRACTTNLSQANCSLRFCQPNCSWHLFQTNGTLSLYQPNFFLHLFQTNCTLHLSKLFRAPFVNKLHLALSAPKTTVLYAFPNKLFSHLSWVTSSLRLSHANCSVSFPKQPLLNLFL